MVEEWVVFVFELVYLTPKSPLLKKERGLVDEIVIANQSSFNCCRWGFGII
jgi:hypothetical protein